MIERWARGRKFYKMSLIYRSPRIRPNSDKICQFFSIAVTLPPERWSKFGPKWSPIGLLTSKSSLAFTNSINFIAHSKVYLHLNIKIIEVAYLLNGYTLSIPGPSRRQHPKERCYSENTEILYNPSETLCTQGRTQPPCDPWNQRLGVFLLRVFSILDYVPS